MAMKLPALLRFTAAEWLFSAKAFAAAMLAVFVANWAGQPRPFWALMTAYIVAHPLAGAVRSKAVFRFVGTLVGSTAAVLLVPRFVNAPELLSLALALWVGGCLALSLLDRTPRGYAFMLSGYTAALVGFPSVDTPLRIFDTAVARVEEIGLGILAATLVHSLVLPRGLPGTVLGLLDRTLGDARAWLGDLTGRQDAQADRARVAADITQLRLLSTHIPYDTTHLRWTADAVHDMQDRVAALTPLLSSVEDRLRGLEQAEGGLAPDVQALLARVAAWLQSPPAEAAAGLPALREALAGLPGPDTACDAWGRVLRIALAERLDPLLQRWLACLQLRADIDRGLSGAPMPSRPPALGGGRRLHIDRGLALLSGAAAMVTMLLCSAFWIATGWPMGSVATMMAAIFCSFFAAMDDPVPAIQGFLKWTLISVPVSALYVLVLLPLVTDFWTLMLVCAPFFLIAGAFVARPATMFQALPMVLGVSGTLALHDTAQTDLTSFLNFTLGQLAGVFMASRVTRLMRSVGADWSARRIQRTTWRELDELARAPHALADGPAYLLRMLDRIALLAPRVAQAGGHIAGVPTDDALRDLRLGADIVELQDARAQLPAAAVNGLLAELADWLQHRIAGLLEPAPASLLTRIDTALAELQPGHAAQRGAISALLGLRRNLFPAAAPALQSPHPSEATA